MWIHGGRTGADDAASDDWRRRSRPENEVPGSVALEVVLGESEGAVVFISGARAYTNGVEFHVEARLRTPLAPGPSHMWGIHGDGEPSDRLLFGIEFADGRRCSTEPGFHGLLEGHQPNVPSLMPDGGGGSSVSADVSMFLSPLPPPGPLLLVCAWPGRGVPETVSETSADPILEAASGARVLWPPPRPREPEPPRAPELPPGSWFAQGNVGD